MKKVGIFSTHPVQYLVPLWRRLGRTTGLSVKVFYFSDHSVRGGVDPGFGVPVAWDTPLLDGYDYEFLDRRGDLSKPYSVRIHSPSAFLRKERFDWIFLQGYTHGFEWQLRWLARKFGSQVVMRGEFTDTPRRPAGPKMIFRNKALEWFYRGIDRFCYIGRQARLHLETRDIPPERLHFSPYCVDDAMLERQYGLLDREACRKELGIGPDWFVFLFSGKLIPRKQPLLLAEAARLVTGTKDIALMFLGDGTQRNAVEQELRPLLGEGLMMPGFVNQSRLGRYFRAADAFILPSDFETWGLVVNEAMQFGLPSLVSDMVGCKDDLVVPGKTGFVFPRGDARCLAERMQWLCENREESRRIGLAAREHVKGYCTERAVQGIEDAVGVRGTGRHPPHAPS